MATSRLLFCSVSFRAEIGLVFVIISVHQSSRALLSTVQEGLNMADSIDRSNYMDVSRTDIKTKNSDHMSGYSMPNCEEAELFHCMLDGN